MPLSFIIVWNAKKKCICQNHLEILSPNAAAALDWNNLRQAVSKSPFSSSFSRAGDFSCDPQKSFYPVKKCEFEIVNFVKIVILVKNETFKMRIEWKRLFWKFDFCE